MTAKDNSGAILMEVLVAVAIMGTAFVTISGLESQALSSIDRMTRRLEAQMIAQDAYARYVLDDTNEVHPMRTERRSDWSVDINVQELTLDDMPFLPVLPVGWAAEWVEIEVQDEDGQYLTKIRPLYSRFEAAQGVDDDDE